MKVEPQQVDLLVVGAGPAGLTAAATAADRGCQVLVVDEHPSPGGKLHTQVHEEKDGHWWKGPEVAAGLAKEATRAGAQLRSLTTVLGLYPGWEVAVQTGSEPVELIRARTVLLAAGACQRPLALPGWTLPGVMTAGAVQSLVNQHGIRPGNRAVIIGTDPLSILSVQCLAWAGCKVEAIILPPPGRLSGKLANPAAIIEEMARHSRQAPNLAARLGGPLFRSPGAARLAAQFFPRSGIKLWGVPLQLRRTALAVEGNRAVEAVRVADLTPEGELMPGTERRLPVDLVVTGAGLSPLVELASQAGCKLVYAEDLGGWVPLHGPVLETGREGLFVAGSMTGVEGAGVAMAQGLLAGLAVAVRLSRLAVSEGARALEQAKLGVEKARAGASIQFYPSPARGRAQVSEAWTARSGD